MLDDRDPGGADDDGRCRRDVHRTHAVPARADDVQHVRRDRKRHGGFEDGIPETDDLVDRLALCAQSDEEPGELRFGDLALHDPPHGPGGLPDAEVATLQERCEHVGPGQGISHVCDPIGAEKTCSAIRAGAHATKERRFPRIHRVFAVFS